MLKELKLEGKMFYPINSLKDKNLNKKITSQLVYRIYSYNYSKHLYHADNFPEQTALKKDSVTVGMKFLIDSEPQ